MGTNHLKRFNTNALTRCRGPARAWCPLTTGQRLAFWGSVFSPGKSLTYHPQVGNKQLLELTLLSMK